MGHHCNLWLGGIKLQQPKPAALVIGGRSLMTGADSWTLANQSQGTSESQLKQKHTLSKITCGIGALEKVLHT